MFTTACLTGQSDVGNVRDCAWVTYSQRCACVVNHYWVTTVCGSCLNWLKGCPQGTAAFKELCFPACKPDLLLSQLSFFSCQLYCFPLASCKDSQGWWSSGQNNVKPANTTEYAILQFHTIWKCAPAAQRSMHPSWLLCPTQSSSLL